MSKVPITGPISITDIRVARNNDGTAGTTSNTFSVLRNGADFSRFDPNFLQGATQLSQINSFSQWRGYPIDLSGVTAIGMSSAQTNTTNACSQSSWTTLRYHNGVGAYPNIGDTIFTDSGGTVVFAGGNFWYQLGDPGNQFDMAAFVILVNNSGVVQDTDICGGGDPGFEEPM